MWCLVMAFGIKAAPSFERSSVSHFIESVDLLVYLLYYLYIKDYFFLVNFQVYHSTDRYRRGV